VGKSVESGDFLGLSLCGHGKAAGFSFTFSRVDGVGR
jgi:hypothetical protein